MTSITEEIEKWGAFPIDKLIENGKGLKEIFEDEQQLIIRIYKQIYKLLKVDKYKEIKEIDRDNIIRYVLTLVDGRIKKKGLFINDYKSFLVMLLAFKKKHYPSASAIPINKIKQEFDFATYSDDVDNYLNNIKHKTKLIGVEGQGLKKVRFSNKINDWSNQK